MLYTVKYADAVRQEAFKYVSNADKLHPMCPLVRIASEIGAVVVLSFEDVRDLAIFAFEMEEWLTKGKPAKPRVPIGAVRAWRGLRNYCEMLIALNAHDTLAFCEPTNNAFEPALPMRWYSLYYEMNGEVRPYRESGETFSEMLEADRDQRDSAVGYLVQGLPKADSPRPPADATSFWGMPWRFLKGFFGGRRG